MTPPSPTAPEAPTDEPSGSALAYWPTTPSDPKSMGTWMPPGTVTLITPRAVRSSVFWSVTVGTDPALVATAPWICARSSRSTRLRIDPPKNVPEAFDRSPGAALAAVTPPNRLREAAPTAAAVLTETRPIRERVHNALRLRVAVCPGDAPDVP